MSHEAISAFIDNEPFDTQALAESLSTSEGRELLIDLIALRHVVAADIVPEPRVADRSARYRWSRFAAVAAIVCLAVGGGYLAGHRTATQSRVQSADTPPAPTRVIDLKPGIDWHPTRGER